MTRSFVDTNILVYAHDTKAAEKREQARALLDRLWREGGGILSTQVMQEFYAVVTGKRDPKLTPAEAKEILRDFGHWTVVPMDRGMVLEAIDVSVTRRIHFWDALLIVAALDGGADTLYTEDLSHLQVIEGVTVINPFK